MRLRNQVLIGSLVTFVLLVASCIALWNATEPATKLEVTVINNTSEPLTHGEYGGGESFSAAKPPLDSVPAYSSATEKPGYWPESLYLHYRVMGANDDTIYLGYPDIVGGVEHEWIVAEGESLVKDSSYLAPDPNHGSPSSWSRREKRRSP